MTVAGGEVEESLRIGGLLVNLCVQNSCGMEAMSFVTSSSRNVIDSCDLDIVKLI